METRGFSLSGANVDVQSSFPHQEGMVETSKTLSLLDNQEGCPSHPRVEPCHVQASRAFVDKIIKAAESLTTATSEQDIMKLALRIEATQDALEDLQKEGLTSHGAGKRLFHAIIDMGQKFLACHEKLCHEAFKKAIQ